MEDLTKYVESKEADVSLGDEAVQVIFMLPAFRELLLVEPEQLFSSHLLACEHLVSSLVSACFVHSLIPPVEPFSVLPEGPPK